MASLTVRQDVDPVTLNVEFEEFPARTEEHALQCRWILGEYEKPFRAWLNSNYPCPYHDWIGMFLILYCDERPKEEVRPFMIGGAPVIWRDAGDGMPRQLGIGDFGIEGCCYPDDRVGTHLEAKLDDYVLPSSHELQHIWRYHFPDALGVVHWDATLFVELERLPIKEHEVRLEDQMGRFAATTLYLRYINGTFEEENSLFVLADDADMVGRKRAIKIGIRVSAGAVDQGLRLIKTQGIFFTGEDEIKPVLPRSDSVQSPVDFEFVEFSICRTECPDALCPTIPSEHKEAFNSWILSKYDVKDYALCAEAPFPWSTVQLFLIERNVLCELVASL